MSELVDFDNDGNVVGRYCITCWDYKKATDFQFTITEKYGISKICNTCAFKNYRFRYLQNRDYLLKMCRRWQKKNPEQTHRAKEKYYNKHKGMKEYNDLLKFVK